MGALLRGENWPVGWPLAALVATAMLYLQGGRSSKRRRARDASFLAGLLTLALAVDSPVDAYADRLFWVHMLQHLLLVAVAPPLLILGRPWPRLIRPLPAAARRPLARSVLVGTRLAPARRVVSWLAAPVQAFVLFNGVLLAWHVQRLFDLTLRDPIVHDLEHTLFFGTALLFWRHLTPPGARTQLTAAQRTVYGVGAILVGWGLALVLGVAPQPLYDAYASLAHRPGGISALADQQLAAGIMWVPASVPFTIAAFIAAYQWLDPTATKLRLRET